RSHAFLTSPDLRRITGMSGPPREGARDQGGSAGGQEPPDLENACRSRRSPIGDAADPPFDPEPVLQLRLRPRELTLREVRAGEVDLVEDLLGMGLPGLDAGPAEGGAGGRHAAHAGILHLPGEIPGEQTLRSSLAPV